MAFEITHNTDGEVWDQNDIGQIEDAINGLRDYAASIYHNLMEFIWEEALADNAFDGIKFDAYADTSGISSSLTQTNDAYDDYDVTSTYLASFNAMSKAGSVESDWWAQTLGGSGGPGVTETLTGTRTGITCEARITTSASQSASSQGIANGTYARNFKISGKKIRINFTHTVDCPTVAGGSSATARFGITDGTTTVWIRTSTHSAQNNTSATACDLIIDNTGQTVDYFVTNSSITSGTSLAALTAYYLIVQTSCTTGGADSGNTYHPEVTLTNIRWVEQDRSTEVLSIASTAPSTVKGYLLTADTEDLNGESAYVYSVSADGGTDYDVATKNVDSDLSAAAQGTSVVVKVAFPHTSSGDWVTGTNAFLSAGVARLHGYGLMWRFS